MNTGWIKSYRKAQNHPIWKDANAWRIFQWIIWNVDYLTGKGTFGKKQISEATGIKLGTVYKVVTRIQKKYSAISTKSSQLFTEISVLNWARYQQDPEEVVTPVEKKKSVPYKKGNTIKEYKEIKNIYISKDIVLELLTYWNNLYKTKYSGVTPLVENVSYWLGIYTVEQVKEAIQNIHLDTYWKNKMTPTTLFRQRNQNREQVDYIGSLLNVAKKESPFTPGYDVHYSKAYEKSN